MAHIASASRDHDICVFIGRFQPPHAGHMGVINEALKVSPYVIIPIGSANQPRRPDANPFFHRERQEMFELAMPAEWKDRVSFVPIEDSAYNISEWTENVYSAVTKRADEIISLHESRRISLIGHAKDHSSFYLKLFPRWGSIDVPSQRVLDATHIREAFFSADKDVVENMFKGMLEREDMPVGVHNWLRDFQKLDVYGDLVEEMEFYRRARRVWENESWPGSRNTVTADALIHQSGYVLLIQRGEYPYKGCWAMPGGHLNTDESIQDCALREGYEETGIKVPKIVFERSLVAQEYFDSPRRDPRGRYIDHTFLYDLKPQAPAYDTTKSRAENQRRVRDALALPRVKGMDDAAHAKWWHVSELKPEMMAFDHYSIIRKMLTHLPTED